MSRKEKERRGEPGGIYPFVTKNREREVGEK